VRFAPHLQVHDEGNRVIRAKKKARGGVTPSPSVELRRLGFYLRGAWAKSDAATVLAAADDFGLLRILLAAEAAFFPVCLGFFLFIVLCSFFKQAELGVK
jgi:hypothetical protein